MAEYLHTMLRITDPAKSRAFYEALGFTFSRDMTPNKPSRNFRVGG